MDSVFVERDRAVPEDLEGVVDQVAKLVHRLRAILQDEVIRLHLLYINLALFCSIFALFFLFSLLLLLILLDCVRVGSGRLSLSRLVGERRSSRDTHKAIHTSQLLGRLALRAGSSSLALGNMLSGYLVHPRRDKILKVRQLRLLSLDHDIGPVHVRVGSEDRFLALSHLLLCLFEILLLLFGGRLVDLHGTFFTACLEL